MEREAVFISDCLLDIPQGAANYIGITRTDIRNLVAGRRRAVPDLGVCIYQLFSSFNGTYYFPSGGKTAFAGRRPYYIWAVGPQTLLSRLGEVSAGRVQHGIANHCAFAPAAPGGETVPLPITPAECTAFGIVNAALAGVAFTIGSFLLKWWSRDYAHVPF